MRSEGESHDRTRLLEAEPAAVATDSKWTAGISPDQPVCEVAGRVLAARLKAVCQSLPLAAEKSDEDVEYVHQLRISVRRAVEALRVFSGLMEEAEVDALRDRLRRIRLAADDARNWDVMAERFSHGGGIPAKIVEQIKARRREVQGPIVAVYQEITADACEAKIEKLVQEVESHRQGDGKRRFGRQAPQYLAPVVKKFFKAAESDLTTDESLHGLRIRTKKLRYTMEIVAVAFDSAFRKRALSPGHALPRPAGNRERPRHGENAVWGLAVEVRGRGAEGFLGGAAAGGRAGDQGSAGGIPGHMDAEGRVRPETAVPGLLLRLPPSTNEGRRQMAIRREEFSNEGHVQAAFGENPRAPGLSAGRSAVCQLGSHLPELRRRRASLPVGPPRRRAILECGLPPLWLGQRP